MKLASLLKDIDFELIAGSLDRDIERIVFDSRKAVKGSLFVAIKGYSIDGHKFVKNAIENGAEAVLFQQDGGDCELQDGVSFVKTPDSRLAIAKLAATLNDYPAKKLEIFGITGTNGKTTTTYLIEGILKQAGRKTGIVGSIACKIDDREIGASFTTPEPLELHALFKTMAEENVDSVVMEVSSQSLEQKRVFGIDFKTAIFSNLSQDHLDFHGDMEAYKKSKSELFKHCETAVINVDDAAAAYMISQNKGRLVTYSVDKESDFQAYDIKIDLSGVSFKIDLDGETEEIICNTPGRFSVYNAVAAIASTFIEGVSIKDIKTALKKIENVKGRFEKIELKNKALAIVDFSHTPDSLMNALKTIQEFAKKKIICVFGCGGDRDNTKRAIMGEVAGTYSDFCIITSDNPRSEEPQKIIDEIETGLRKTHCAFEKVLDRKAAIHFAIDSAGEGDIILVAGKGHEDYQIIADKIHHFDDSEVIRDYAGG